MNVKNSRSAGIAALAVGALALSACGAESTGSDDFPSETIEVIIGFDAGGSTDVNTRALAAAAEEPCGTSIIISNQPGGSGAIALDAVRNAPADGYTLGTTPTEISALDHMGLSDVTHEDLSSVIRFIVDPHGFFVRSDSQFSSMQDVIDAARDGERIRVATSGPASPYAITFQDVARTEGVQGQLVNVPFSGDAAAIPAALSGEVDLLVSNASNVQGQVESGDLVPLALAAEERIDSMPDAPTLEEEGIDVEGGSIYGLAAPAGTPDDVISTLSDCFAEAFESEEFQSFLDNQGSNAAYLNAADYDEYLAAEYERYGSLINELGLGE
jgi:tripartite-type tricarboxylate transporter receptor subunit TctC